MIPTGEKCAISQTDPNVWYLAPTFGGAAEHTCTIPKEKALPFPLLVRECNYLENPDHLQQMIYLNLMVNDITAIDISFIIDLMAYATTNLILPIIF